MMVYRVPPPPAISPGFQTDAAAATVQLHDIVPDGGLVPLSTFVIQRVYPVLLYEKTPGMIYCLSSLTHQSAQDSLTHHIATPRNGIPYW